MNKKIIVLKYRLPDYAVQYLINGDAEGLTVEEYQELHNFSVKENVVFVSAEFNDAGFQHSNDMNNVGANCLTFIAHKL